MLKLYANTRYNRINSIKSADEFLTFKGPISIQNYIANRNKCIHSNIIRIRHS